MSMLGDNWCTLEEAESKFGIGRGILLEWVREGIVRSEDKDGKVSRVNLDDLELKVKEDRL